LLELSEKGFSSFRQRLFLCIVATMEIFGIYIIHFGNISNGCNNDWFIAGLTFAVEN